MAQSVNVDGVRRLLNVSPSDMTDDEIRVALVRLADAANSSLPADGVAARVVRFAEAIERLEPPS
jgi:hypothetical protein